MNSPLDGIKIFKCRLKQLETHQYILCWFTERKKKHTQRRRNNFLNVHIWIFISKQNECVHIQQRQSCTAATTKNRTLIHCAPSTKRFRGCYLFRMCIATKHIFHIDNELSQSTPTLLAILYFCFVVVSRYSFESNFFCNVVSWIHVWARVCVCSCVSVSVYIYQKHLKLFSQFHYIFYCVQCS